MKPLGVFKHIFCYVTLGLLCGWYYVLLVLFPVLIYYSILGSLIAKIILSLLIILSISPLNHKHSKTLVNSFLFKWWGEYFDFSHDYWSANGDAKAIKALNKEQRYMLLEFPHGIMPMGMYINFNNSIMIMHHICYYI